MDYRDYLEHYGVLGMHWGIRKDENGVRRGRRRAISDDYKKTRELRKQSPRTMTNTELRLLNERLNLEKQYKNLNPKKVAAGQKFLAEILREMGKESAKAAVKETLRFTFTNGK